MCYYWMLVFNMFTVPDLCALRVRLQNKLVDMRGKFVDTMKNLLICSETIVVHVGVFSVNLQD